MAKSKLKFKAETAKLLDIVINSLYSDKDIFLRELISNASDACDKLRYEALTNEALLEGDGDLKLRLSVDKDAGTITLADNGIGMNRDDLVENLGTIAKSGTEAFRKAIESGEDKSVALIGQFGVGFYSAFMVAEKVEVKSRKAGDSEGWIWISEGAGTFTVDSAPDATRGAEITLHLRESAENYLDPFKLRQIVKTYSDHIALPIVMAGEDGEDETLNTASAIWTRSQSEISADDYKEFYNHVGRTMDDPWLTMHNKVEGVIEYTNLLFVPTEKPFDLFEAERKQHLKLYVRRVFITDDCPELLPAYMRFVRGVVDSQDLPLNVSRETLQANPVIAKIKSGLVKRILGELKKKAEKAPEEYAKFWGNFGALMKEGLYEDYTSRDDLLALARFRTTGSDELVSLADYVGRMKEGQDQIFYISGDDTDSIHLSPQLEGFKAKGVEVLLLTDPVDEFWIPSVGVYEGNAFTSVTRGSSGLDKITSSDEEKAEEDKADTPDTAMLIARFKVALGEQVKDIRASTRLTDSACCLVADEGDADMHLERLLRRHNQVEKQSSRIFEINPKHPMIKRLGEIVETQPDNVDEAARLLLDQARIVEGETVTDPVAFAKRLTNMMTRGLVG
ncbi:molecular chaperone HtpG [Alphaproteobacteria bacterium HT1-32]|nr:molecular chaperone HtpG [Alphaproteobacteria bacterium HT1-32]